MSEQRHRDGNPMASGSTPEARYSYYRRCQLFRRSGEQCKAPAEKGSHICYAHAAQQAMAFRRDLERRIVLAEAVAEMRRRGNAECDMDNLLMDFNGIQVTLAVVSRSNHCRQDRLQDSRKIAWCICRRCQNCCGWFTAKDAEAAKKIRSRRRFAQKSADRTRARNRDCRCH